MLLFVIVLDVLVNETRKGTGISSNYILGKRTPNQHRAQVTLLLTLETKGISWKLLVPVLMGQLGRGDVYKDILTTVNSFLRLCSAS